MKIIYEALINNSEIDTIDPVIKISITTDQYTYDYTPKEITQITIRKR